MDTTKHGQKHVGRQSREDESMLLSAEDVTTARLQVLELGSGTVKWDQNEDVRDSIDLYRYILLDINILCYVYYILMLEFVYG